MSKTNKTTPDPPTSTLIYFSSTQSSLKFPHRGVRGANIVSVRERREGKGVDRKKREEREGGGGGGFVVDKVEIEMEMVSECVCGRAVLLLFTEFLPLQSRLSPIISADKHIQKYMQMVVFARTVPACKSKSIPFL